MSVVELRFFQAISALYCLNGGPRVLERAMARLGINYQLACAGLAVCIFVTGNFPATPSVFRLDLHLRTDVCF